jgi:hypothetical protein
MKSRLHIVAPCANRKRMSVPQVLRLQSVRERDLTARARAWCMLLESDPSPTLPAMELYAGDHWTVVRTLRDAGLAAGYETELWILSAGYGLVPAAASLHAYSATFVIGHPDSIADRNESISAEDLNQTWWLLVSEWAGPMPGAARSLQELAARDADAGILTFGSPDYVRAVEKDLSAAAASLRRPERLVVISSRGVRGRCLDSHLIESDAGLQSRVGGCLVSLNARAARLLLEVARVEDWSAGALREQYLAAQSESPSVRARPRRRMSDEETRRFIGAALSKDSNASATALLRQLRQEGRACEQVRFKRLVREAQPGRYGA